MGSLTWPEGTFLGASGVSKTETPKGVEGGGGEDDRMWGETVMAGVEASEEEEEEDEDDDGKSVENGETSVDASFLVPGVFLVRGGLPALSGLSTRAVSGRSPLLFLSTPLAGSMVVLWVFSVSLLCFCFALLCCFFFLFFFSSLKLFNFIFSLAGRIFF